MSRARQSRHVGDYHDEFVLEVEKAVAAVAAAKAPDLGRHLNVLEEKVKSAFNGFETSTFTVCSRIRPVLLSDQIGSGENFVCVVPGGSSDSATGYCEPTRILVPTVGITGKAKIECVDLDFDYTFGADASDADIFARVGAPLVARCLAGQVGVIFAYGQTGSGKTHTMNGLMDGVAEALYVSDLGQVPTRDVSFSYIEILGQSVTDCLDPTAVQSGVQVGETLDGRVEMRNLLAVDCPTAAALRALVESAKGRRATESTERNATSSRSHGVGIVTVGPVKDLSPAGHLPRPAAGRLYIIDLAGSERMSDCRGHSDSRMDETKAINVSLMSLKECIRARTLAGMGDGSAAVHVPYRRSKLTLIMKDVFDISCRRLCSTVVIAHTSPLARDVKHSTNTLQYAAPLRVSAKARTKKGRQEVDPRDPACWSRFQVEQWIQRVVPSAAGVLTVDSLIAPGEKGIDLCMMAEAELYNRVRLAFDAGCTGLLDDKSLLGEPAMTANTLYSELWSLICDAKVRRRHPSGALITAEEEAAEVAEKERLLAEKSAMWAEREAHMKSDLVGYDGKPIV